MANWTVALDKPVSVEPPNAVAYVTWTSDDATPRITPGVRVPYAAEVDLLNYLAHESMRLKAVDDRNTEMAAVVASATITKGPLTLPDISKQQILQAAQTVLLQKVTAALVQPGTPLTKEQIAAATAIDPTVADAVQAVIDAAT